MRPMLAWLPSAGLLAVLVAVNAGLALRPVDVSPVAPERSLAMAVSATDGVSPPDDGLAMAHGVESLARPLFHRDRRPFHLAPPPEPEPEEAPEFDDVEPVIEEEAPEFDSVAAPMLPSVRLLGVSVIGGRKQALLLDEGDATSPQWVAVGESVGGWMLEAVEGDGIALQGGGQRIEIELYPSSEGASDDPTH